MKSIYLKKNRKNQKLVINLKSKILQQTGRFPQQTEKKVQSLLQSLVEVLVTFVQLGQDIKICKHLFQMIQLELNSLHHPSLLVSKDHLMMPSDSAKQPEVNYFQ